MGFPVRVLAPVPVVSAQWDAASYRDVASVQRDWGRALAARHEWRGDERVLDAGCGTADLAAELLDRHPDLTVIAVDSDPNMVGAAREHLARFGTRARVEQADIAALPPLPPCDVVFTNAVLHWVADHAAVFRGFKQALRSSGVVLGECGGAGNLKDARAVAAALFEEPPFAEYQDRLKAPWYYPAADETRRRLRSVGFVDVEVEIRDAPVGFPDDESWTRFLRTVVLRMHMAALPEELREDFLAAYRDRAGAAGLKRRLDYVRLRMKARRP
jgi:trans-aconitate 2-methyltransferase